MDNTPPGSGGAPPGPMSLLMARDTAVSAARQASGFCRAMPGPQGPAPKTTARGRSTGPASGLSRLGQARQTEWTLLVWRAGVTGDDLCGGLLSHRYG